MSRRDAPLRASFALVVSALAACWLAADGLAADTDAADAKAEAQSLYKKKEYARAVDEFLKALAASPFDADAYYQLGQTYEKLGDNERAVQAYDMCVMAAESPAHRSQEADAAATKAQARSAQLDKAGAPMRKASSDFVREMKRLANSYLTQGQYWQARKAFRLVLGVSPNDEEARAGAQRAAAALGEPGTLAKLEKAAGRGAGREIGTTGARSPVDVTVIADTGAEQGETPTAGIEVGKQLLQPARMDPGVFFVAISPSGGKVLDQVAFRTRDAVASGAQVNLFVDRLPARAIVAVVCVGRFKSVPPMLAHPLRCVGIGEMKLDAEQGSVFAAVGVKGAAPGTAASLVAERRAVVRLCDEVGFRGPLDEGAVSY